MKGELLILFVILLLGLILCSFLGGKGCIEGMENKVRLFDQHINFDFWSIALLFCSWNRLLEFRAVVQ